MDGVGHSRLLKFLIDRMDDPIESKVPGEQIIRGDDIEAVQYEPVITVTQQETTTTRGNITAQKITVTEDISGDGEENQHGDKNEEKKTKTRIPMLKKAVRQVIQAEDKKKMAEDIPIQRRKSSIPRLSAKHLASSAKAEKENTDPKIVVSPKTEEEFDKLFEEIKQNSDRMSNAFIKDPVKLEMKFEEIIHDYDENKVEPINVEKLKTRIPMLKRKSEHDIEATKLTNRRRFYKKRSSIQNPQQYSRETLSVQSKTNEKDKIQSETNVDGALTIDSDKQTNAESKHHDVAPNDTVSDKDISLGTSEASDNMDVENNEPVLDNNSVQNKNDENKILKKSQSIDISHEISKQIEINSSLRRSLSQCDNVSSKFLVQRVVEDQNEIKDSERPNTSIKIETMEVKASEMHEIKQVVNNEIELVKPLPHEIETIDNSTPMTLKQDMVCKETSMLIRKNQNEIESSEEPLSLEMELSYSTTDSIHIDQNIPVEHDRYQSSDNTENPASITLNNEIHVHVKDKGDESTQDVKYNEKEIDELKQGSMHYESKPIICNTETKVTKENDISDTLSSQNMDSSLSNHENSEGYKPQEIHNESAMSCTEDSNKYLQVPSINSGDQIPTRGHPDALFNRPETPIEDFLPTIKGSKENLAIGSPKTDITGTEDSQNNTENIDRPIENDIERIQEERRRNKEKINELLSDAPEEDIIILKGKVDRVISRLDSRDYSNIKNKQEIVIENVPKKTVLSKIVLFERKEAQINQRKMSRNPNADLPKIVDEILKQPKSEKDEKSKKQYYAGEDRNPRIEIRRELSYAEVDLGDAVKGRVRDMIVRMVSLERMDLDKKGIDIKEKPRSGSVSEKIALFENKGTTTKKIKSDTPKHREAAEVSMSEEELKERIEELRGAKKIGKFTDLKYVELNDGSFMPALGVGTALLHKSLTKYVICAAIDLGYRTIDTAFIYGNEKEIGEAVNEKISDGTVKREDLFIISKLWSTFHRRDLVEKACKISLKAMGLEYFDLYLIHNPMSFKEGDDPIPKIANVIQYSESDYLDAWFGLEKLVKKGLVRRVGVSNFNSAQIDRILDKGRIRPVINQIECHPYLTQYRLEEFCQSRDVKLSCYGVLGSKGTPLELKSGLSPVIDDPMVLTMAAGLEITPAQLLISYQLHLDHSVVVKASTSGHLWSNLQAQSVKLDKTHISALNALNRNKRNFTFRGMGETHRNYPFRIPF